MTRWEAANLRLAGEIRELLEGTGTQLVCAESCTAGLVAATLAKWPGISGWLCGSLVVYQTDVKHQWLDVDPELLNDPCVGPVSREVTGLLAVKALEKTPRATLGVAVTGHLGPGAPEGLDGVVFVAVAQRLGGELGAEANKWRLVVEQQVRLTENEKLHGDQKGAAFGRKLREERMSRAVSHVLDLVGDVLRGISKA